MSKAQANVAELVIPMVQRAAVTPDNYGTPYKTHNYKDRFGKDCFGVLKLTDDTWPLILDDDTGRAMNFETEAQRNNWIKDRLREKGHTFILDNFNSSHR